MVTRPQGQAEGLIQRLRKTGAEVKWLELLEVTEPTEAGPLQRACREIERFDWVTFTSANAVAPVLDLLPEGLPSTLAVAAVGKATARALRAQGVEPRLVSRAGNGAGLAAEMAAAGVLEAVSVLLPLASDARPELAARLVASGAHVTAVVAYEKRVATGANERVAELFPLGEELGWVTFTSPRLAATFAEMIDRSAGGWEARRSTLLAASIGLITSVELRRLGVEPTAEAETPADGALVEAILRVPGLE